MAEYRYYLIPDAMTRAFPEQFGKQTPTEFFDNIADLEKRYSVVMYLLVWLLNNFVQPIAAISMNFLGWSIVYWVISVAIFLARLYFYGHNPAVVSRV